MREKCTEEGWCFYLYGCYFEKDEGGALAEGHMHDWEHLGVWTLNNDVKYLAWSAHGRYTIDKPDGVLWQNDHPKFVVERDKGTTHAFRKAKDNKPCEDETKEWCRSPLVSVKRMDETLREKMLTHDWGYAHPDLADEPFDRAYSDGSWESRRQQH